MPTPHFSGIKYSSITKIYYRWHNHNLQRFVTTRTKTEHWGWESSDYQDISGNSTNWTKSSMAEVEDLIKNHNPNNRKTEGNTNEVYSTPRSKRNISRSGGR